MNSAAEVWPKAESWQIDRYLRINMASQSFFQSAAKPHAVENLPAGGENSSFARLSLKVLSLSASYKFPPQRHPLEGRWQPL